MHRIRIGFFLHKRKKNEEEEEVIIQTEKERERGEKDCVFMQ